ncbi:DMT family transporter [Hahella sp. CR1]|uniref:DMT family transporter n=1 Tax=Hahella sp. CR1 TaxID=2992807 RepID=UPI0024427C47|nr:EamA family transporter [Hahella sp. CR1]MDG9666822.1 DMT family transporter [Hahella sp. CR1]
MYWLLGVLAPAVWGTTYVVTQAWLQDLGPLWVSVLRALPAGLLLMCLDLKSLRHMDLRRSAILGALNISVFFFFLFTAALRLPSGVAGTLMALTPLTTLLFLWWWQRQAPNPIQLLCAFGGLIGVGVVIFQPSSQVDPVGVAASFGAVVSLTVGTFLAKKWSPPKGILAFTGLQLFLGGMVLLPLAFLLEGPMPTLNREAMLGLLWVDLVNTALGYLAWFIAMRRLPVSALSFLALLSPVSAVISGRLVLEEWFTPAQYAGIAMVLLSVTLAQFAKAKPQPKLAQQAS